MFIQILIIFVFYLIFPGFLLYSLWQTEEQDRLNWFLTTCMVGAYILFIYMAAPWSWISYYLRFIFLPLWAVAAYFSWQKSTPFAQGQQERSWAKIGGTVLPLLVFLGALLFAIRGYFYSADAVSLSFPLQDSSYYVGQGGNSHFLNYHNPNPAQQYALDIVALNGLGARASGLYPSELEKYVIYGATVYSPCTGTVLEAVDGLPDQIPPARDTENLAGNHVIIECQGVQLVLAHLQEGTVQVTSGESVDEGQPLGKVGNSGNTTEPHLHIHAVANDSGGDSIKVMDGEGVPLLFDGKFLVRNSTFSKSD